MKFQKPSMHGSKVMLRTKKRDRRMDGQTQNNMPSNFFKVEGIKIPGVSKERLDTDFSICFWTP